MKLNIMKQFGYLCDFNEGHFKFQGEAAPKTLVDALSALPDSEAEFLALDLDTLTCPVAQRDKLKAIQVRRIQELRRAAYRDEHVDDLFFAWQADGDGEKEWRAKRAEVKALYPWPGDYR